MSEPPVNAGSRRSTAIIGLVLSLLVGCSLPGGRTVEETPATIIAEGKLGQMETGCPYLATAAGRVYLHFDPALVVLERPLRILSSGEVVATIGDHLRVSGPDGIGETICGPGEPMLVDRVQRLP